MSDLLNDYLSRPPADERPRHAPPATKAQDKPRKSTAVVSGKAIDRTRPTMVRWSSILLLLLSLLCTIVAFHGNDWQALRAPSLARTLAAVALQVWCTAFQWYNRRRKLSVWYLQAFLLDMIPSAYAFGGIVAFFLAILLPAPAAAWLVGLDLRLTNGYTAVVWLIAAFAGVQLARIPEDRLISE